MLAIWVDFLMIFTLLLMPEYPWLVQSDLWLYKVFYYIQIHLPIANAGYKFYLVIFYILAAILFISVAICVWVGWCFMNDNFPFLWPIKVARVVVSVFVSMFYIASLNVFLMACACKKDSHTNHWLHLVWGNNCFSLPHLIHVVFSITSAVVFFTVALLLVLGDHELEPMSKSLLAAPHSMCELRALLCKTVITVADIILKPVPHLQVVLYCVACGLLFYYHARMVPHYVPWINVLRGGLNAVLAWVSLVACILSYTVEWEYDHGHPVWHAEAYRHTMTVVMAVGVPVMFVAGGGVCWMRLVYAWRTALKFKQLPPGVKPRSIHRFTSEFDVEVASRIGRVWDEEGVLDTAATEVAENVLKAGVAMKPNSVYLHIVYSNYLIDVRHNQQLGWSHLEQAKKLEPNLSYQFSIFTRGQEHKQKAAAGGDNQSVDLVSYVEFQKNYRALLVYHKASLVATRDFWRLLTRDVIPMERLGHSFKSIDEMEVMAEKTYRLVLDRYPTNAKLLKSYGKFLENVKNDPWGAARYYAEAEKQEELAENTATELNIGDGGVTVDDKSAIITINAQGIIQLANKPACAMFGYNKGELEGKNVNCLMPQPFSMRHNSYLSNYINTGHAKLLDLTREVVAMHKERYVFPLVLTVSKLSGSGAESTFMSVLKEAPEVDSNTIRAWLLTSGTMLCADQSFLDYAGWSPRELVGRAFSSLGADSSELDDLVASCANYTGQELEAGAVQLETTIRHKYAQGVPVRIKFEMGGTESQRVLVAVMTKLAETVPMAAFDQKGRCMYANTPLASMLGYQLSVLRTKEISQLLPQPYGALHMKWIPEAANMSARQTPNSCRNNNTSVMLSSNGTPVYVKTDIVAQNPSAAVHGLADSSSDTVWAVKVTRSTKEALLGERRMQLLVSSDGRILWASPASPAALFGLEPAALVGQKLQGIIDLFAEYCSGLTAGDVAGALAALMSRTASRPGSSWRVGVGASAAAAVEQSQVHATDLLSLTAKSALTSTTDSKRLMVRQVSARSRLKAAIMTVSMPTDDVVPEDVLMAAGEEAALVLDLWRADMLLGVAEVVEGCMLVRVEPSVGLLLGINSSRMLNSALNQWLSLPADSTTDDLMGTKGTKKGGLKSSRVRKIGPRLMVNSMHEDRRPVSIVVQACVKEGSLNDRLLVALKVSKPLAGAPGVLASLIATEAAGLSAAGWSGGPVDGLGTVGELINLSSAGGPGAPVAGDVPVLDMSQVGGASARGEVDLLGTNTHRATHRSNADSTLMATARMIDIDLNETGGSRSARKQGRAPAVLVDSPTGDEGQVHQSARTPAARDMAVSSGSEDDEGARRPRKGGISKNKKQGKHMTEEEEEAMQGAKGARKAREWLESGFGGYKAGRDRDRLALPGAVYEGDGPLELVRARHSDDQDGQSDAASEPGQGKPGAAGAGPAGDAASASEASASVAGDAGAVGDYSRGKRLRKLTRLLSSKAATQVSRRAATSSQQ
eukprot:GHRQ01006917.1.p1 GENE.GHRQ01006917.1~~GHRQ01006917.1.p1  ORF type:complete len:1485 (+),score=562.58 GHRQ01006917.1:723-5177(+)